MDYEKLHKDTITKLQEMVNSGKITVETACGICADFVPESEDERIRKRIIHALHGDILDMEETTKAIAWLEKQGEQKPIIEMKSAEESLGIDSATYNKIVDECIYGDDKSTCGKQGEQKPTNWLQELEDKLANATPKQLAEWKEKYFKEEPTWSEEDYEMLQQVIADIEDLIATETGIKFLANYHRHLNWLKSLKERYTWKPSDEQINTLQDAIVYVEGYNSNFKGSGSVLEKLYRDLKKLKG